MPPTHTQAPCTRAGSLCFDSLEGEEATSPQALAITTQELPALPPSHPTLQCCLSPSFLPVEQSTATPQGLTEEVPLRMLPRATLCRWISTRLSMSSSSSSCKERDKPPAWGAAGHSTQAVSSAAPRGSHQLCVEAGDRLAPVPQRAAVPHKVLRAQVNHRLGVVCTRDGSTVQEWQSQGLPQPPPSALKAHHSLGRSSRPPTPCHVSTPKPLHPCSAHPQASPPAADSS